MNLPDDKKAPSKCQVLRASIAAALSALLLTAANPNLDCAPLAWVALVPWLLFLKAGADSSPSARLRLGIVSAIAFTAAYAAGLTYWIVVCALPILGPARTIAGFLLLILAEAVFYCAWAIGVQWLYSIPFRERRGVNPNSALPFPGGERRWGRGVIALFGIPALWVLIVEWGRQLGPMGLTWGGMAYTQHGVLPILQMTKLTGTWGLAYLIVLVNVSIADAIRRRRFTKTLASTAVVMVIVFFCGWGQMRSEALNPSLTAAILQGNIDPNVEHDRPYVEGVVRRFTGLTDQAAGLGATLTVWPEMAYPGYIPYNKGLRDILTAEAARRKINMVVGGPDYNWARRKNLNSLFLITDQGIVAGSYHKRRLVPFGEYVPAADLIPAFRALHVTKADMLTGAAVQTLMPAGPFGKIGSAICFESSFPELLREQTARGANLLVVSTDDSWFDHTAETRQHAAMSAVRAVENDRYVLRAATTGVSQIIDPTGRVVSEGPIDDVAVIAGRVEHRSTRTLYVRWGNWFVDLCAVLLLAIVGIELRGK